MATHDVIVIGVGALSQGKPAPSIPLTRCVAKVILRNLPFRRKMSCVFPELRLHLMDSGYLNNG